MKQQIAVYMKNLNRLELQKAMCGALNVSTNLSNEIEETREQIYHLTRELKRQEGILPQLEALSFFDEASEHVSITEISTS